MTINRTNGNITASLLTQATTGVGFYINATRDKELNELESGWDRNNRYVLHNRIYYRGSGSVSSAKAMRQFIPVDFGDDLIMEDEQQENPDVVNVVTEVIKSGVYDMQGRQVATEAQVSDGTWRQQLAPGMYIVNGRKVSVK